MQAITRQLNASVRWAAMAGGMLLVVVSGSILSSWAGFQVLVFMVQR